MSKYDFYANGVSIEAVFDCLGGVAGAKHLLSTGVIDTPRLDVKPRWNVSVGGRTMEYYRRALAEVDCQVRDWTDEVFTNPLFPLAQASCKVPLAVATARELGFAEATPYQTICARIVTMGHDLVPPEAILALLVLCAITKPVDEWLVAAMSPLTCADGRRHTLTLEHDDGTQWISAYPTDFNSRYNSDDPFVFIPNTSK